MLDLLIYTVIIIFAIMINCGNCNSEVAQNYCPNCGNAVKLKRIDGHYIQHEIVHVLHFEKGIFYTIKELLIRPGQNIRKFISTDRSRLVKPVIFIIITSLIYTLLTHFFHIDDSFIKIEGSKGAASKAINNWIHSNYGYSNILEGLLIALWLKLFFWKSGYNFFEIVILLCFVMGIGMLIFSLAVLFRGLTQINLMQPSGIAFYIYATWAIGQFFNPTKVLSYIKAFVAYIIGMVTFSMLAMFIGYLIDIAIR